MKKFLVLCTAVSALGLSMGAAAAGLPIKVGMSLPSRSVSQGMRAGQVASGVKAYIERVNAAGGVNGRRIEIIALDDEGDLDKLRHNAHELVQRHHVVALLNCLGEDGCRVMAQVATEENVPLLGVLSGETALDRRRNRLLYRVRADHQREAEALAQQLKLMACFNVAVLTEGGGSPEMQQLLALELQREGLKSHQVKIDQANSRGFERAVAELGTGSYQAVVLALSSGTLSDFIDQGYDRRDAIPRVVMLPANGALTLAMAGFPSRALGFSSVVPNPEVENIPLARELEKDADRFASSQALTFDGMEAYLGARVLVEGLRRIHGVPDAQALQAVLGDLEKIDMGGFSLSFAPGRSSGSDRVDIGVRSRSGVLLN